MSVRDRIIKRLETELSPLFLKVDDFSETHKGHAGYKDGGGSHISVEVVSAKFDGLSRIDRHKLIYSILNEEISAGLHALKIKAMTELEQNR